VLIKVNSHFNISKSVILRSITTLAIQSISGDTIVVGAWCEDSNATGVNGDQNNNGAECETRNYMDSR
jgi:hypothetical protein